MQMKLSRYIRGRAGQKPAFLRRSVTTVLCYLAAYTMISVSTLALILSISLGGPGPPPLAVYTHFSLLNDFQTETHPNSGFGCSDGGDSAEIAPGTANTGRNVAPCGGPKQGLRFDSQRAGFYLLKTPQPCALLRRISLLDPLLSGKFAAACQGALWFSKAPPKANGSVLSLSSTQAAVEAVPAVTGEAAATEREEVYEEPKAVPMKPRLTADKAAVAGGGIPGLWHPIQAALRFSLAWQWKLTLPLGRAVARWNSRASGSVPDSASAAAQTNPHVADEGEHYKATGQPHMKAPPEGSLRASVRSTHAPGSGIPASRAGFFVGAKRGEQRNPAIHRDVRFIVLEDSASGLIAPAGGSAVENVAESAEGSDAKSAAEGTAVRKARRSAEGLSDSFEKGTIDIRSSAVGHHVTVVHGARAVAAAFQRACDFAKSTGGSATVVIPGGVTLLLSEGVEMRGPCGNGRITLQVDGSVVANPNPHVIGTPPSLITLSKLPGLRIAGSGTIDGRGFIWWRQYRENTTADRRPALLTVNRCNGSEISGITLRNAPKVHLHIKQSHSVTVEGVSTFSPGTSPNTDSIHLSAATHVLVQHCHLHGGDDDVSIVHGCHFVTIRDVLCTAGHGISIGSLGEGGSYGHVSHVLVENVILADVTVGLRIKTYQGGSGMVHDVAYRNIVMRNVGAALVIDQFYCDKKAIGVANCPPSTSSLSIMNVAFSNITGTCRGTKGVIFNCSDSSPCKHLKLDNINILSNRYKKGAMLPAPLRPLISNVQGTVKSTSIQ